MEWYFWVVLIVVVIIGCFMCSCARMSGFISKDEAKKQLEEEYKLQHEIDVSLDSELSHIEKSAVDQILKNINEDVVTYIPANVK